MPKTVVILCVSSDIGSFLAKQYSARGWRVIGTYRQAGHLAGVKPSVTDLFKVDLTQPRQIKNFIAHLKRRKLHWDRLICLSGSLVPAQDFFECDFDQWQESVMVNALGPLRVAHGLYPLGQKGARVVFFAGGAANGAVVHMSAYAISKIMLTKMTEFIDAEYPHLHVSIIGPGWTMTKIHQQILGNQKTDRQKRLQTKQDMKHKPSTRLEDIDACVEWVCSQPKKLTSGRNFSVVYDPWRPAQRAKLASALSKDVNMYKLRRCNNDFLQRTGFPE